MLKVLHLRSSFDPGGTETLLLHLFNYKQDKIKFYYLLLKNGQYVSKLKSDKNIYLLKPRRSKIDLDFLPFTIGLIKKENISIIHSHQLIELIFAVIIKVFLPRIKVFHSIHLYNAKNDWKFFLERALSRFSEKTIVVSQSLKNKLVNRGFKKNKLIVLYNAVNFEVYTNKTEINVFKKLIKYTEKDIIISMIGNFVPEKDQETIARAFVKYLANPYPELKLVFIGKKMESAIECEAIIGKKDINQRVFLTGALKNASQYLKIVDLFIMSSKSETFGIVIIEALLNDIPVIASDIDTFKELSYQGKYFKLFKTGNEENLAKNIKIFLDHKKRNKNLYSYSESKEYAVNNYSYKTFVSGLEKIYRANEQK